MKKLAGFAKSLYFSDYRKPYDEERSPMFKLETEHLILRDMRLSDENAFVAMSQDN